MERSPLESFTEKMQAVGGRVTHTTAAELAQTIAGLVDRDRAVLTTPELEDLAGELADAGLEALVGTRAAVQERTGEGLEEVLARSGSGVVSSLAGIASTGTLAVGPGGGNGGLLAAYPPHSVIVLRADEIVARLEDALRLVGERFSELGGEVVFVSGPSRTADIEMMSVVGVHGPTGLDVVVVTGGEQ